MHRTKNGAVAEVEKQDGSQEAIELVAAPSFDLPML